MPNFVQEYRSTDQTSWPNLTGQAGSLIALLDAILVNGGTTNSVTSLTEAGATITAVIASNATLETGDYLTISGASPAGANGTFPITVLSATSFTYVGPGSLARLPARSSISARRWVGRNRSAGRTLQRICHRRGWDFRSFICAWTRPARRRAGRRKSRCGATKR